MRRQVEKVMEIATLDGGREKLQIEAFDALDWVKGAVEAIRAAVALKEGSVALTLPNGGALEGTQVLPPLSGDRTHLDGVLSNLLDNAVRYSGDAPPDIHVCLAFGPPPKGWVLTVEDRGIGIPPEHQGRVFEPFFRILKASYQLKFFLLHKTDGQNQ